MRLLLILTCALLLAGCQSADEELPRDVPGLVAAVVEAHGGERALAGIEGYRAEGRLNATHRGVLIRTTRWYARPDRLLLELDYPGAPEWRLTNGAACWKGASADGLAPARGPSTQSMQLQTARFDTALRLLQVVDELELRPADDRGRPVLRHDWGNGLRVDYHVDPGSRLITRVTMGMTGPLTMEFAAEYSGYRPVQGVMLPHRELTWAGEALTSKVVIDTFVINAPDVATATAPPPGDL